MAYKLCVNVLVKLDEQNESCNQVQCINKTFFFPLPTHITFYILVRTRIHVCIFHKSKLNLQPMVLDA